MRFASFDLETATALPDDIEVYTDEHFQQLGISVAGVALSDADDCAFWCNENGGAMTADDALELLTALEAIVAQGYHIVTWNGTSFDFRVLAIVSGMFDRCAKLARHHIDMMLYVVFTQGHRLALSTALESEGFNSKLRKVKLSDGTILNGMSGADAPALWDIGEYDAVMDYLEVDILAPLPLVQKIHDTKELYWVSKSGIPRTIKVPELYTAIDCFNIPKPDVSWMTDPPDRNDFFSWMPGWQNR